MVSILCIVQYLDKLSINSYICMQILVFISQHKWFLLCLLVCMILNQYCQRNKKYCYLLDNVQMFEFFEFSGWQNRGKISSLIDKKIVFIYNFKEWKETPVSVNWLFFFFFTTISFLSSNLLIKNGVTNHREIEFKELKGWEISWNFCFEDEI